VQWLAAPKRQIYRPPFNTFATETPFDLDRTDGIERCHDLAVDADAFAPLIDVDTVKIGIEYEPLFAVGHDLEGCGKLQKVSQLAAKVTQLSFKGINQVHGSNLKIDLQEVWLDWVKCSMPGVAGRRPRQRPI
jgi:hypothetical protein